MTTRCTAQWIVSGVASAVSVGLLAGGPLSAAGGRFLLAVDPRALPLVLSSHELVVDDEVVGHGVYRVRDPRARDTTALLNDLHADVQVQGFEIDQPRVAVERPRGLVLDQSTDAILETLGPAGRAPFYGSEVPRSYVEQPAASIIGLEAAHARSTGSATVAIIDTGVDPLHPVLRGVLVPGYDFTRDQPGSATEWADISGETAALLQQSTDAILEHRRFVVLNQSTAAAFLQSTADAIGDRPLPSAFGHGTMVAGLIHLAAPTAEIMPLKVFKADGSATLYDIVRAIYYAADHGARVINMSFSMSAWSIELERAVRFANARGAVLASSAGNAGRLVEHLYPASSSLVLGVGSTSATDVRSLFSNYGNDTVDLAAPGEALLTTYPGGAFALAWGTSFSTALTSGGASLLVRGIPEDRHDEAERIAESMLKGSRAVGQSLGLGRISLPQALEARDRTVDR